MRRVAEIAVVDLIHESGVVADPVPFRAVELHAHHGVAVDGVPVSLCGCDAAGYCHCHGVSPVWVASPTMSHHATTVKYHTHARVELYCHAVDAVPAGSTVAGARRQSMMVTRSRPCRHAVNDVSTWWGDSDNRRA